MEKPELANNFDGGNLLKSDILAWIHYLGLPYWYKDQTFIKSKPVLWLVLAGVMGTLLHSETRRLYSWWWDSHISPKNSKWLKENLTGLDTLIPLIYCLFLAILVYYD